MINYYKRLKWLVYVFVLVMALPVLAASTNTGTSFEIKPPSQYTDLMQLANAISDYIFKIALPVAFGMIIYGGVRFVLAQGNSQEVQKAKDILKYTIIGLAIILINKGFVSLISDILGVQAPATSTPPTNTGGGVF